jgi:hypothetical protein
MSGVTFRVVSAAPAGTRPIVVRVAAPRPPARVTEARGLVERRLADVRAAGTRATGAESAALHRLALLLDFARGDRALREARLAGVAREARRADAGTFLMNGRADRSRYLRHHGIEAAPTAAADTP